MWTDEVITFAKDLYQKGLSAATIAESIRKQFNIFFSRSAIIGKSHRGHWVSPERRARSGPKIRKDPPRREVKPTYVFGNWKKPKNLGLMPLTTDEMVKLTTTDDDLKTPAEQRRTLLALTKQTCHWGIGDPLEPDFFFCGGPTVEGLPYCQNHVNRAYIGKLRKYS